jgi:hypothetical protein
MHKINIRRNTFLESRKTYEQLFLCAFNALQNLPLLKIKIVTCQRSSARHYVVRAMDVFNVGEGIFQEIAGWKPVGRSRSYFAQLITSVKPRDTTKFMEIAPIVSVSNVSVSRRSRDVFFLERLGLVSSLDVNVSVLTGI